MPFRPIFHSLHQPYQKKIALFNYLRNMSRKIRNIIKYRKTLYTLSQTLLWRCPLPHQMLYIIYILIFHWQHLAMQTHEPPSEWHDAKLHRLELVDQRRPLQSHLEDLQDKPLAPSHGQTDYKDCD